MVFMFVCYSNFQLKWKLFGILSIIKTNLSWKELLLYSSFSQWPSPLRPTLPTTKLLSPSRLGLTLTPGTTLADVNTTSCGQEPWLTAPTAEESPFQPISLTELPNVELPLTTRTWPAAGPPPKVMPSSPNGGNDQTWLQPKYHTQLSSLT